MIFTTLSTKKKKQFYDLTFFLFFYKFPTLLPFLQWGTRQTKQIFLTNNISTSPCSSTYFLGNCIFIRARLISWLTGLVMLVLGNICYLYFFLYCLSIISEINSMSTKNIAYIEKIFMYLQKNTLPPS